MARKFTYHGLEVEDLKKMPVDKYLQLIPSKLRRSMKRMGAKMKIFIQKMRKTDPKKPIRTQMREMVVLPEMIDRQLQIYNGKEYVIVVITPQMLGKRLGDFAIPIKLVKHSGPGIGATRGSKSVELK